MTEQPPSAIGTVAQEAARLIEEMATMARLSYPAGDAASRSAGAPASGPAEAPAPEPADAEPRHPGGPAASETPDDSQTRPGRTAPTCSECGADRGDLPAGASSADDLPQICRLCPLCRGIALLRSVRPETVDLLADLAVSLATSLREIAVRSRASEPPSSARPASGAPQEAGRAPVQDIPVDDESEG